jgi:hypothetical protein
MAGGDCIFDVMPVGFDLAGRGRSDPHALRVGVRFEERD